jgi:ribosomal protein S18 acetylase RimI-like enzyme
MDPLPVGIERVISDTSKRMVLIARDDGGSMVATVTVGDHMVPAFDHDGAAGHVRWRPAESAVGWYVNRLAVHPTWQQHGLGREMMARAEHQCAVDGATSIRLEAFAANAALLRWYDRLGYERCGSRAHSSRQFVVFEKIAPRIRDRAGWSAG